MLYHTLSAQVMYFNYRRRKLLQPREISSSIAITKKLSVCQVIRAPTLMRNETGKKYQEKVV